MNKELVQFLKDRCSEFGKPETYVILPFIIEKVGDSKFTEPLLKTVESICRRVPGNFIVGHIIKYIRSTEGKKPKLNSDACVLISKVMENISIKNIPLR